LRLVVHREIPADEALRRQWNELVQQMERPEVFYTYEWALAVDRAYRVSLTPLLLLSYEDDLLVGCAALATKGQDPVVSFLAGTTADYCDFISAPAHRSEFVKAAFEEIKRLGIKGASLANLPADSATSSVLKRAAGHHGYSVFSRPAYLCARVTLGSAQEKQSTRESVRRKQMVRRHLKGMEKIAPVSLRHLGQGDEIAAALPAFISCHVARFRSQGRISNLASPERQAFLRELAALLSPRGWLVLSSLNLGETPVAWNYGFQFAGSWFWYQPTLDSRYHHFYPGYCLLAKIIEAACDAPGINLVDLGLGDETYKERFATSARQTLYVTVNTSAVCLKQAVRYQAVRVITSNAALERAVRGLRARLASAWQLIRPKKLI
jgi:CelD/BcsL family acetyltransferase involved in cellulose biosynthesis